jgi:ADP-ribose pyrophosphatase YjhB (NUDIX family)
MSEAPSIVHSNGSTWHATWHPPGTEPAGTPHGASGICFTASGDVLLISPDGDHWGFPGGRTEPGETWRDTLDREVHEEAAAIVTDALLLGFARSEAIEGRQHGTILVRSFWRATVELEPNEPRFEIPHRRLVPVEDVPALILAGHPDGSAPTLLHIFETAIQQ